MASSVRVVFNHFGDIAAGMEPAAAAAVANTTSAIADTARAIVAVDTGELRDSIAGASSGLTGTVEAGAEHAEYVEYGTSRMAAQPYLRPAADMHRDAFEQALDDLFGGVR